MGVFANRFTTQDIRRELYKVLIPSADIITTTVNLTTSDSEVISVSGKIRIVSLSLDFSVTASSSGNADVHGYITGLYLDGYKALNDDYEMEVNSGTSATHTEYFIENGSGLWVAKDSISVHGYYTCTNCVAPTTISATLKYFFTD